MADNETPDHHGSHRDLLWSGDNADLRPVDAIIVPTARPPAYLTDAAGLAEALGCALVTLHSRRWTTAAKAVQRLPRSIDLIAIDIPDPAQLRLPQWETSRVLAGNLFRWQPGVPRSDLFAKRNIGLILSRLLGWSRVLFLDDDITELNPADVLRASGLLSTHAAVGLQIGGFPDHSVVCHAYRQAGGRQQSFIGGGALAVHVPSCDSFFPEIYNDDWFFLLDGDKEMRSAAVTGRVVQYRYDPFRNPDRARAEEFGDVLAEGIYWLLDQGRSIADADQAHWEKFLVKRGEFIRRVLGMVADATDLKPDEKARRIAALKGSLGRLARITPQMCEDYLQAWRADRQAWQRHLKMLPAGLERASALAHLSADGASPLNWQPRRRGSRYQHADTVGVTQLSATHPGNGDLAGIGPDAANVHAHSAERERVLAE